MMKTMFVHCSQIYKYPLNLACYCEIKDLTLLGMIIALLGVYGSSKCNTLDQEDLV